MAKPATTAPARVKKPARAAVPAARKKLYGAIRSACSRLGIDDDDRKSLQSDLIGKASMSDMSIGELGRVLDRLNRDWSGPMAHRPHIAKVKALWWSLYWLGEVESSEERALSAFVQRQTGVSALRFLGHTKATSVIEALKSWATRAGVEWPTVASHTDIASIFPTFTMARYERLAVLTALGYRLYDRGYFDGDWIGWLGRTLGLTDTVYRWSDQELDAAITALGQLCRGEEG